MCTKLDRIADERDAALDRREASVTIRELKRAGHLALAEKILVAGERRDYIAAARDEASDSREDHLDRAQFLAHDGNNIYDEKDLPKRRRHAALDRDHAKEDREASRDDRIAFMEAMT